MYNITTEQAVSVLDMIRHISQCLDKPARIKFINDRKGQIYKEHILSKRLQQVGWKANVSFQEGVQKCVQQYELNGQRWVQHSGVLSNTEQTTRTDSCITV